MSHTRDANYLPRMGIDVITKNTERGEVDVLFKSH